MSTSDPHLPSGEPDPVIEPTSPLTTTRGAAARAAAAHAAQRPTPTPPPGVEVAGAPAAGPGPVVEPVAGRPAYASTPVHGSAAHVDPATPVDAPPVVTPPVTPTGRTDVVEPVAPRSTGFGGHLWGVLIGLLATAAALALGLVGQGRILGVQADTWDASLDRWGIAFVTAAVLLLAVVVYLGVRTAAAPISGGILATVAGAMFLYAPGIARNETMRWLATTNSRDTVSHATVAATSGTILLVGFLLLVAGVAIAAGKRRGRVLGEFRERGRVA